jgi:hypothetical protein
MPNPGETPAIKTRDWFVKKLFGQPPAKGPERSVTTPHPPPVPEVPVTIPVPLPKIDEAAPRESLEIIAAPIPATPLPPAEPARIEVSVKEPVKPEVVVSQHIAEILHQRGGAHDYDFRFSQDREYMVSIGLIEQDEADVVMTSGIVPTGPVGFFTHFIDSRSRSEASRKLTQHVLESRQQDEKLFAQYPSLQQSLYLVGRPSFKARLEDPHAGLPPRYFEAALSEVPHEYRMRAAQALRREARAQIRPDATLAQRRIIDLALKDAFMIPTPPPDEEPGRQPVTEFPLAAIVPHIPYQHDAMSVSEALLHYRANNKQMPSNFRYMLSQRPLDEYAKALEGTDIGNVIGYLASGGNEVTAALVLADGSVLKLFHPRTLKGKYLPHEGYRKDDAPIKKAGEVEVGSEIMRWQIMPFLRVVNYSYTDELEIKYNDEYRRRAEIDTAMIDRITQEKGDELARHGIHFHDFHPYQLGKDAAGKVWVLDHGAVGLANHPEAAIRAQLTRKELSAVNYKSISIFELSSSGVLQDLAVEAVEKTLPVLGEHKFRLYYGDDVYEAAKPLLKQG